MHVLGQSMIKQHAEGEKGRRTVTALCDMCYEKRYIQEHIVGNTSHSGVKADFLEEVDLN